MKEATAVLQASLDIDCPYCHNGIDLFRDDQDGIFTVPVFGNRWDDLKGAEATCPFCGSVFKIKEVEW